MAISQGSKPVKKASAPKKSSTGPSHPPYIDMIKEALVSLKERTGSSTYAIAKHIEEQQKVRDLPPNFRKLLAIQIKRFVASGKLVKVKNSFKLPSPTTTATAAKKSAPPPTTTTSKPKAKETAAKKKTTSKPKAAATKKVVKSPLKKAAAKKPKSIKSPVKKGSVAKKGKK